MPKKNKIVQSKNQAPPEAGGSPAGMKIRKTPTVRGTSTTRKTSGPARQKSPVARKGKVTMPPEAGTMAGPSDEEIRLRAYFISERRLATPDRSATGALSSAKKLRQSARVSRGRHAARRNIGMLPLCPAELNAADLRTAGNMSAERTDRRSMFQLSRI